MKLNSAILSIPLLGLVSSVYGQVDNPEVASPSPDPVEEPSPIPEVIVEDEKGLDSNTTAEGESDELWDSVSDLFFDNGVYDLEAIDIRLHVRTAARSLDAYTDKGFL